jgi:hypothetical protein
MTKLHDGVLQLGYLTTPCQFYKEYTVERYGTVIVHELENRFFKKSWPVIYTVRVFTWTRPQKMRKICSIFPQQLFNDANQLLFRYVLCLLPVSVAVRLLGSWVRIPLRAWLLVSCVVCFVCSYPCDGLITGGVLPGVCVCLYLYDVCLCLSVWCVCMMCVLCLCMMCVCVCVWCVSMSVWCVFVSLYNVCLCMMCVCVFVWCVFVFVYVVCLCMMCVCVCVWCVSVYVSVYDVCLCLCMMYDV